ncbi:hypothetical protein BH11MYX3_BH11MYX3_08880 [soil metagenome]
MSSAVTRHPHAARRSRVAAAIAALALVMAGLLGVAHEATTRHVRCAEHGELIHSATVTGVRLVASDTGSLVDSLPTTETHDHEHCLLAAASRALTLESRPLVLTQIPVVASALAVAPAADARPGYALYRTAPKTSPPA